MKRILLKIALVLPLLTGCCKSRTLPYDGMPFQSIYIREEYEQDDLGVGIILYQDPENPNFFFEIYLDSLAYEEVYCSLVQDFPINSTLKQIGSSERGYPIFTFN